MYLAVVGSVCLRIQSGPHSSPVCSYRCCLAEMSFSRKLLCHGISRKNSVGSKGFSLLALVGVTGDPLMLRAPAPRSLPPPPAPPPLTDSVAQVGLKAQVNAICAGDQMLSKLLLLLQMCSGCFLHALRLLLVTVPLEMTSAPDG